MDTALSASFRVDGALGVVDGVVLCLVQCDEPMPQSGKGVWEGVSLFHLGGPWGLPPCGLPRNFFFIQASFGGRLGIQIKIFNLFCKST